MFLIPCVAGAFSPGADTRKRQGRWLSPALDFRLSELACRRNSAECTVHGRPDGTDFLTGRRDNADTNDRDESGEQRVFDQVLALLITHERNDELFHNQMFSLSALTYCQWLRCCYRFSKVVAKKRSRIWLATTSNCSRILTFPDGSPNSTRSVVLVVYPVRDIVRSSAQPARLPHGCRRARSDDGGEPACTLARSIGSRS
jgi:hypothetical protein